MKQLVGSGAVKSKTLRDTAGHERIFFERQSLENLLKADQPHICYSEVKQFLGLANPETLSLAKARIIRCERSGDIDTRINPKERYLLEDVLAIKESFASTRAQTADSLIGNIAIPVKPPSAKVPVLLGAEEMCFRHLYTRISHHQAVCLLDRSDVARILRRGELHYPVGVAGTQFLQSVDDGLLIGTNLSHYLWARAAG